MNLTAVRLLTFGLSAALAGMAGAFYGGQQGLVGANDFTLLASLSLLLLAVVWGIRTMSGMLLAAMSLVIFPVIQTHVPSLRNLIYLGTGLAAIGIGRNPNGVMGGNTPLQIWRDRRMAAAAEAALTEAQQQHETTEVPTHASR
jgi:branched-chain amino acid transport system permease protein